MSESTIKPKNRGKFGSSWPKCTKAKIITLTW